MSLLNIFVSVDKANERAEICRACDKFTSGFCKECACMLKFKVLFANSDCPLNKWKVEEATDSTVHSVADDLSSIVESTTTWDNWKAIE
jgi:hypothetical protein